jgi:hypothetical protein
MRRALQYLIASSGATIIIIALLHIVIGPSCVPGGSPANATTDSEDRYFAVYFLAHGATLVWCVRDVELKGRLLELLALVFFLGGVTRLISMAIVGLPHPFFVALTPLELGMPLLWWWMARKVARAAAPQPIRGPTSSLGSRRERGLPK